MRCPRQPAWIARTRRGARGAAPRCAPSGASAGDCRSIRSVRYGTIRIRSRSPAPRAPACPGSRSRRRACRSSARGPARRTVRTSAADMPMLDAASAARSATAAAWPSEYGDFRSMKSATASSACVELARRQHDGERRLGADHRSQVSAASRPDSSISACAVELVRQVAGRTACPAARRTSAFAASTPPTRWATSANSPMAASLRRDRARRRRASSPGQPLPSHCSYDASSASRRLLREAERLAQPAGHRGVVGDHRAQVAVAGHRELQADPEPVAATLSLPDPSQAEPGQRALQHRARRGRTCRPSGRCRRRTTSPARGRPSGSPTLTSSAV